MALAHLLDGAYREVEPLLRVVAVGEQHVRPPDRVAVDGQTARETRLLRQRKSRCGDVTAGWAIDRISPVDAADDVADVVAVDEQLVRLLHRSPARPRDELRRPQNDRAQQTIV